MRCLNENERFISKPELTSKNMEIINVSSKGQIVIPENVRKHLNIKTGVKLVLFEKENFIVLKKEEDVSRQLEEYDRMEARGWLALAEKSLKKVWDNKKDDETWGKYL